MRHVSLYDLPDGDDRGDLLPGLPDSFGLQRAEARFFARGESSARETVEHGVLLVVAQGACVVRVDGVAFPACRFDVLAVEAGEAFDITADEIDPALIFRIDLSPR